MKTIRSDMKPILAGVAAMILVSIFYVRHAPDVQPIMSEASMFNN